MKHNLRMCIRYIGSESGEKLAQDLDNIRFGRNTGMTFEEIKKKYKGNCHLIIEKSGMPNPKVNAIVSKLLPYLYSLPEVFQKSAVSLANRLHII